VRGSVVTLLLGVAACGFTDQATAPLAPGGDTTIDDRSSNGYSTPAANLDDSELALHLAGDLAFAAKFVSPPATLHAGLGPMFNNVSCASCHLGDGRGMPTLGGGPLGSQLLVRVSLPPDEGQPEVPGGSVPVPGLGLQLQDQANFGVLPEVSIVIDWIEVPGTYGDGTPYSLRRPSLSITLADGSPLPAEVMTSLRQPPPVFGLGLLEAVPETDIVASADPDDADDDGISGRPNRVWSPLLGRTALGRFGHKANNPTLEEQTAAAYANDMGVSNPIFPDPDQDAAELDLVTVQSTAFYARTLGVPGRGEASAASRRGEALFASFGCAGCHTPDMYTGPSPSRAIAFQHIAPYTDLLLHDLGEGLADGRPDFLADGNEWRTAPLWGIGMVQTVSPGAGYLHDGRARSLEEAVLWHGGEAEAAREGFRMASAADRSALVAFLLQL
jgi:CxxC motif-containing protein (DUF1111 family)